MALFRQGLDLTYAVLLAAINSFILNQVFIARVGECAQEAYERFHILVVKPVAVL